MRRAARGAVGGLAAEARVTADVSSGAAGLVAAARRAGSALAPSPAPMPLPALAALLSAALALGCAAEPPLVPPTELVPIEPEVRLARRWTAEAGAAGRGRFEPRREAERVVVADEDGRVSAFDRRSGRRLWRTELDLTLSSGVGGDAESLYVASSDGVVHALAADGGAPRWRAPLSSEVLVPPVAAFGAVVARSVDGRVVALESEDGRERWSVSNAPPALTLAGSGRPLLVDGGALVGLDDGRLLALDLDGGRTIWEAVLSVPSGRSEVERLVDVDVDPVAGDSAIYVANYQGRAARVEPARGQIAWSVPLSAGAGLALVGDTVVVVDEEDALHALERDSGRERWRVETLRGRRLSPPAALGSGEAFVVGDLEGYLHVISADDGRLLGRTRATKAPIEVRPLVEGDEVISLAVDGRLAVHDVAR